MRKSIRKKKVRKARWNRIFILVAAVIMILAFACQALGDSELKALSFEKVVVTEGDTLWSLINEYNGNVDNMNKAIYQVKEINGMDNASIYVGQVINMPTDL